MSVTVRLSTVLLGVSLLMVGCSSPPTADVDAARAAVDRAAETAGPYAADSVKAAQDARAALDAEMQVQDEKWFKSVRPRPRAGGRGQRRQRQGRG